ncbi:MAG TPA: metallophosphoesterase family protein, partial [Flavitalea sp.]|nr:metallophosphoesterase family protein [Flavitalea sp.]
MLLLRNTRLYLTLLLVSLTNVLNAQSAAVTLYPPTPDPDRVVLNVTADLSNSLAINWRTCDTVKTGFAEIMPVTADPRETKNASRYPAKTESFELQQKTASYHSVSISNLIPNTTYMYRVGSGEHWSEWFHVKTASASKEKVSFMYFGDVQAGIKPFWSRVIRQAYAKMPDANLVLYAGDIVNRGFNDHEWGELFDAGNFIHSIIPGMMSPGNHEHADNAKGENQLTTLWRPQFNLPENGPAGLEETCYYSDVQGVRFISLNSQAIWFGGDLMEKQKTWLHTILKSNPNKWTCIVFHHPVYSVKANRDNTNMREQFQPIFD